MTSALQAASPNKTAIDPLSEEARVALVSMPFCFLDIPSIGLSLLKAALGNGKVHAKIFYFALPFAKMVGVERFESIDLCSASTMGEVVFADSLFERQRSVPEDYAREVLEDSNGIFTPARRRTIQKVLKLLSAVQRHVEPFLHFCLDEILAYNPRIVGFSSIFQQQIASLALARRIKKRRPETFVIFGGSNCQNVMGAEMIRQFPFVDAVVSGEGDVVFPELVDRILDSRPLSGLQGVYCQETPLPPGEADPPSAVAVSDLDTLPYIDYDDYFEQLEKSGIPQPPDVRVLCETSRGCYWGKCAFCSLNCDHKGYRTKSGERALKEIRYFCTKYPQHPVQMVDNIIPNRYFKDLLPGLVDLHFDRGMFYEIRANLRKDRVVLLKNAGFSHVQIGVESLSTPILKLMRKGVSALQNIQLLKWCREMGLDAAWNFLWGFPGEPAEEYNTMACLIPSLTHLQPPGASGPIALARFSPHFKNPRQFGFSRIRPAPSYKHIYPFEARAVENLAFFFFYGYRKPQNPAQYTKPLQSGLASWREASETSCLCQFDCNGGLGIWDQRPAAHESLTVLTGIRRKLYEACDSVRSFAELRREAGLHGDRTYSDAEIEEALAGLLERRLMISEGDLYLSLAVAVSSDYPGDTVLEQIRNYLRMLEQIKAGENLTARIELRELPRGLIVGPDEAARACLLPRAKSPRDPISHRTANRQTT